ncbi:MAG TPA: hypothetical protein VEX37_16740, partial [Thermomicrobiales bacterium]|nr:hypothetical protein [Thermomicrobiales bacterium]
MTARTPVDQWLNRFFDVYYRSNPVSATFIGVHSHDGELPVPDSLEHDVELAELLEQLENDQVATPADVNEEIDLLLAGLYLRVSRAEKRSGHLSSNPCYYTGEAIFGIVSLFLRNYAPLDDRLDAAVARLRLVPGLLEAGSVASGTAPEAWVDRAINECAGAEKLLRKGVPILISRSATPRSDVLDAC